jgi:two-component system, cell cycle response regulator
MRWVADRDQALSASSKQVGELAAEVGHRAGMDGGEWASLQAAAHLHDIGMLSVADETRSKPGPLDLEEWERIRRHPEAGYRVIARSPGLRRAAELVLWSHERFDGRGYPDGLTREEIPLGSRIIFACASFQAMISDRPHCEPRSRELALGELRRNAGTQFDPLVVEMVGGAVGGALSLGYWGRRLH